MENFKQISWFVNDFTDNSSALQNSVCVGFAEKNFAFKFSGVKQHSTEMAARVRYIYEKFALTGKYYSGGKFIYKVIYGNENFPVRFFGRFLIDHAQSEKSIKNSIALEYKQESASMSIKLRDNPMNLVLAGTFGDKAFGAHGKIKSDMRLKEILKLNMGIYYMYKDTKFIAKHNFRNSETHIFFQQGLAAYTSIIQDFRLASYDSLPSVSIGFLHQFTNGQSLRFKAGSDGKSLICISKTFDKKLLVEGNTLLDFNKTTMKTLSYSCGFRIVFNI